MLSLVELQARCLVKEQQPEELCTTDDRRSIEHCADAACRYFAVRMEADIDAKIGALYTATLPSAEPRYANRIAGPHTHQAALKGNSDATVTLAQPELLETTSVKTSGQPLGIIRGLVVSYPFRWVSLV
jgi:hypothetical protein